MQPLTQHIVRSTDIGDKEIEVRKPGVVSVKFVPKPGIDSGYPVVGLLNVDMKQSVVNSLGKRPVALLFHQVGISRPGGSRAGK